MCPRLYCHPAVARALRELDAGTSAHCGRTGGLADMLGRALQLSSQALETLRLAAELHVALGEPELQAALDAVLHVGRCVRIGQRRRVPREDRVRLQCEVVDRQVGRRKGQRRHLGQD